MQNNKRPGTSITPSFHTSSKSIQASSIAALDLPELPYDRFISMRQASARVGLSRSSIYEFIKKGKFPRSYLVGLRAKRFLESEIDTWIKRRVEQQKSI